MSGITVQLDTMPAPVMAAHCRGLFEAIGSFFDDPDNQAKFEAWHKKKYGCLPKDTSYGSVNNEQAEKEARRRSFHV